MSRTDPGMVMENFYATIPHRAASTSIASVECGKALSRDFLSEALKRFHPDAGNHTTRRIQDRESAHRSNRGSVDASRRISLPRLEGEPKAWR